MTDPITDMLNIIRNAKALLKEEVLVPFSKIKYEISDQKQPNVQYETEALG